MRQEAWRSLREQPAVATSGRSPVQRVYTQHELAADRLGVPLRLFSAERLGCFLSRRYAYPMWNDDLDWLEFTYPLQRRWRGSEAERAAETEQVCLRRLEAICWPEGPRANARSAGLVMTTLPNRQMRRAASVGAAVVNQQLHVLQAIAPIISRTHQPIALWFRAIFLISNYQSLSSIALGERLRLEQKIAWELSRAVRQMRADYPDLIQRIVTGPAADSPVRRRSRKTTSATARKPSADMTGQSSPYSFNPL